MMPPGRTIQLTPVILVALAIGPSFAAPVVSDSEHPALLPELQTVPSSEFLTARRALSLAASQSEEGQRARAQIDLVRFYLDHALIPEARGAAALVDKVGLVERDAAAFQRVNTILSVLSGKAVKSYPDGFDPAEAALWTAVSAINDPETDPTPDLIDAALPGLAALAPFLKAEVLPQIWEASAQLGAPALPQTRALSDQAGTVSALIPSDQRAYLSGHAAEMGGDLATASRVYLGLSGGTSQAAAKARNALVRLWLSADRPDYGNARKLLEYHLFDWRGDAVELELYALLARIYEETAALPEAVGIMGRILSRFPDSHVAHLAEARAQALIPRLYEAGFTGKIDLPKFLEHHARNHRLYGDHPVFHPARAKMAHWLRQEGASDAAAQEFAALRAMPETGPTIVLREAEARLYGGQANAAWDILAQLPESEDASVEDHRRRLLLLTATELETPPATPLHAPVDAAADDLRLQAALMRAHDSPSGTTDALTELTRRHQSEINKTDAVHLFLAARQSNQPNRAKDAAELMDPANDDRQLADTILAVDPDFSALRLRATHQQLDQTQTVLDMARALVSAAESPDNSTDPTETNRD